MAMLSSLCRVRKWYIAWSIGGKGYVQDGL